MPTFDSISADHGYWLGGCHKDPNGTLSGCKWYRDIYKFSAFKGVLRDHYLIQWFVHDHVDENLGKNSLTTSKHSVSLERKKLQQFINSIFHARVQGESVQNDVFTHTKCQSVLHLLGTVTKALLAWYICQTFPHRQQTSLSNLKLDCATQYTP